MKNLKIIQELHDLGITGYHEVVYNPSYEELYQAEMSAKNKGLTNNMDQSNISSMTNITKVVTNNNFNSSFPSFCDKEYIKKNAIQISDSLIFVILIVLATVWLPTVITPPLAALSARVVFAPLAPACNVKVLVELVEPMLTVWTAAPVVLAMLTVVAFAVVPTAPIWMVFALVVPSAM